MPRASIARVSSDIANQNPAAVRRCPDSVPASYLHGQIARHLWFFRIDLRAMTQTQAITGTTRRAMASCEPSRSLFPRQRISLGAGHAAASDRISRSRFARTPIADSMDQPPEIRIRAHKIGASALSAGFFARRCALTGHGFAPRLLAQLIGLAFGASAAQTPALPIEAPSSAHQLN